MCIHKERERERERERDGRTDGRREGGRVRGRRGGRGLKVMGPPWGGDGGGAWGEETVHRIPSRQTHTTHLPVRPGMKRGKEGRAISTPPL